MSITFEYSSSTYTVPESDITEIDLSGWDGSSKIGWSCIVTGSTTGTNDVAIAEVFMFKGWSGSRDGAAGGTTIDKIGDIWAPMNQGSYINIGNSALERTHHNYVRQWSHIFDLCFTFEF